MDIKDLNKKLLEDLKQDFVTSMNRVLRKEDGRVFNINDTVRSRKNKNGLAYSFIKGGKFRADSNGVKALFKSNTKYAAVQEQGAFIKSKGKMEGYFWARFMETNNTAFKIIALSVRKKGGVDIKPRPYIEDTGKQFRKFLELRLAEFQQKILERFRREAS